ncbi:MAG TPA: MFS transporter [Patescibacteria group bacterium]|nr:MFS transporter [Patescibacteria group bacterium]
MNSHPVNLHHTFLGVFPSYFARKARSQVLELFTATAILDFAVAMVMIFEPIYLYNLGYSLSQIMYFYLGVYVLYFFLMPLGAKYGKQHGFEHSIFIGSLFHILYYVSLAMALYASWAVVVAVLMYALQKTFYWPGYHADFALYSVPTERGREIGNMTVIVSLVFVLGPLFGGVMSTLGGFPVLFMVVALLILLSNIPLFATPEQFDPSDFSYWKAYQRLFAKETWREFFSYIGFGEELIVLTLWPVFMFLTVKNNLLSVGSIVAGTTLITSLVVLFIGKMSDQRNKRGILKTGSVMYSCVWILRALIGGPVGIMALDTLSRIMKDVISVPLTVLIYHHAQKTSVMKSVVFFEMALVVGKIVAIILVLCAFALFGDNSWDAVFLIAAGFSLLYTLR